ncbi:MAG TPA: hypothetical protein VLA01_04130 [Nitrosopumilaceae archaeon]|nr:hypothetical protein [Nitrosopumilaceae archaeon]
MTLIPFVSGSIDSFDDKFVQPSIAEQQMFKNLLEEFLKLDIEREDVSGILDTFEKPQIVTFPCNIEDVNNLVVNVVETRHAGFTVPEEHEGGVIVGGTYSWQCKITTSSKGIITMDCDNTLKLNPDVINPNEKKDPRSQEVDNLVIIYHELLHGQLMLDAISSSQEWRNDVCNKTTEDKIDYSYSDKQHIIIDPLQEKFADQLINKKGGVFFLEEIIPTETQNGEFSKKITSRFEHDALAYSGVKVTYRGINTNDLTVIFPESDITISGTLIDKTKSGRVWLYIFPESSSTTTNLSEIPEWIKNNAAWWSEGTINDSDFLNGIEFLIQNNILKIQGVESNSNSSEEIPLWIRHNAQWWSSGLISDEDFLSGIKYLIEVGIISYP